MKRFVNIAGRTPGFSGLVTLGLLLAIFFVQDAAGQRGAEETKKIRAALASIGVQAKEFEEISENDTRYNYYLVYVSSPAELRPGANQTIYHLAFHTSPERAKAAYEPFKRDISVSGTGFDDPKPEALSITGGEGLITTGNGLLATYSLNIPETSRNLYTVGYARAVAVCGGVNIHVKILKASSELGERRDEFTRLSQRAREELSTEMVRLLGALRTQGVDCGDKGRVPVIFIPGVAGTILNDATGYELWPTASVGNRPDLAFEADGRTSARRTSIKAGDILRRTGMNFYGGFMKSLENEGYKEGVDLIAFPYDWRFTNDIHYGHLDTEIRKLLERTGKDKVIIAAHSMGGVIARGYVYSSKERAGKVSALVTMGTPYWGSPKVYYGITSGYQFGNPTVRQELMKVLLQNMPAAYQLLPQVPFIRDKKINKMISLEAANRIRYKWFKSVMPSLRDGYEETVTNDAQFNAGLLDKAKEFYAQVGSRDRPTKLPDGVRQYAIIGTGVTTLGSYDLEDSPTPFLNIWPFTKSYLEIDGRKVVLHPKTTDGDGTVPLWSLESKASTTNYYIRHAAGDSAAHGDLPANRTVQSIVTGILKGVPPSTGDYPRPRYWMDYPMEPGAEMESMSQFELHSDAHLRITAANGRVLGYASDGSFAESLPGTFLTFDGKEYASVGDTDGPLTVSVEGIRTGKFTLNVTTTSGGRPTGEFRYDEVPVRANTRTEFVFTPSSTTQAPDLQVTNGTNRTTVKAVVISPLIAGGARGEAGGTGEFLGKIGEVGATVTGFKLFDNPGEDLPPVGLRPYKNRFKAAGLKAIYFEFSVDYAAMSSATYELSSIWKRNGELFAKQNMSTSKPSGLNTSVKTYGYVPPDGKWPVGNYTVDIVVSGNTVATTTFVVE